MGLIPGYTVNKESLSAMVSGLVKKDNFFNEVLTLEQKDIEKWSDPVFFFKFENHGKWYLATFYEYIDSNKEKKLTLAISLFDE